jgi:hypothetical protein
VLLRVTRYFDQVVRQRRPEIQEQWIERVLAFPVKQIEQTDGRLVFWGNIPEAGNRVLRVVTLEDGETIHNAFFDRNFYRRQMRGEEPI